MIDSVLNYCSETKTEVPAVWACRAILALQHVDRNFLIIVEQLLRLARDFPSCMHYVAEFLINHQRKCYVDFDVKKRI
jgi:hypothetical protein